LLASRGQPDTRLRDALQAHPFYDRPPPRSTGREDFNEDWLDGLVAGLGQMMDVDDLIASAVDAVAADIAECVGDQEVILAGGSVANHELVRRIRLHSDPNTDVLISDELGIPAAAREALGFAVFGALSQDHVPISLPQVTGAADPGRAGAWILP
jgi:anhydro-N-acetylmuramic acid kinase